MEELIYTPYEVLSEKTQKYSTTHISGGGTDAMATRVNPITSHTTVHSDQELWLRNLENGREEKLTLRSFNIDARPGHRVVTANKKTGAMVRAYVVNTGYSFGLDRVYNPWRVKLQDFIALGALCLFLCLIPFVGPIIVFVQMLVNVFGGRLFTDDSRTNAIRLAMLGSIVAMAIGFVIGLLIRKQFGSLIWTWLAMHVPIGIMAAIGVLSCYFILRELSVRNGDAISARIESVAGRYSMTGAGAGPTT